MYGDVSSRSLPEVSIENTLGLKDLDSRIEVLMDQFQYDLCVS
jgi:hypothetical protein